MQFFEGGESEFSMTTYSRFHKSLFGNDYEIESFPTSEDEHILMFSEDYARKNFSFFWMNFVSTIQIDEGLFFHKILDELFKTEFPLFYKAYLYILMNDNSKIR